MECPYCNKEHADTAKFCEETGKPLEPQVKYCQEKGCNFRSPLPLSAKFCPNCGKLLGTNKSESVQPHRPSQIIITTMNEGCEIFVDSECNLITLHKGKNVLSAVRYPWLLKALDFNFGTEYIISIDLTNFDTTEFESMQDMFSDCSSIENLDLSLLVTHNVQDMSRMFQDCTEIKEINLSGLSLLNVKNMNSMFKGCYSLEILKLNGVNIPKSIPMRHFFKECRSLKRVEIINCNQYTTDIINYCLNRDIPDKLVDVVI